MIKTTLYHLSNNSETYNMKAVFIHLSVLYITFLIEGLINPIKSNALRC